LSVFARTHTGRVQTHGGRIIVLIGFGGYGGWGIWSPRPHPQARLSFLCAWLPVTDRTGRITLHPPLRLATPQPLAVGSLPCPNGL